MPSVSFTTPNIMKVGLGAISGAILALAVRGTVFVNGGNVVSNPVRNPNSGIVYGVQALFTPAVEESTATGGNVKVNGGAKYNTINLELPFGPDAAARGQRSGSGIVYLHKLDIVRNGNGISLDCVIKNTALGGTGGTMIFNNVSATGSYVYQTAVEFSGLTQHGKCGTLGTPKSDFYATWTTISMDTDEGK